MYFINPNYFYCLNSLLIRYLLFIVDLSVETNWDKKIALSYESFLIALCSGVKSLKSYSLYLRPKCFINILRR